MSPRFPNGIERCPRSGTPSRRADAFTLPELLIIVAGILVLVLLVLPRLARARVHKNRSSCVTQLRNLGLGLRIFSTDNNGTWPWQVSTNDGGSREFLHDPSLAWTHFHALSNELSLPGVLRCPADRKALQPGTWADAQTNSAFSYFLGLDASEEEPASILGGDSNLELDGQPLRSRLVTLQTNANIRFDGSRVLKDYWPHATADTGNMLHGDGSVQQVTSARLRQALFVPGDPTHSIHRWLIP